MKGLYKLVGRHVYYSHQGRFTYFLIFIFINIIVIILTFQLKAIIAGLLFLIALGQMHIFYKFETHIPKEILNLNDIYTKNVVGFTFYYKIIEYDPSTGIYTCEEYSCTKDKTDILLIRKEVPKRAHELLYGHYRQVSEKEKKLLLLKGIK